eukprot:TRINITY_DN2400_c0_g1_i2.p1 TRINITY_DN2400_c0_g1~~TRINITY_DN2400_c0_g1_i2.p1  ORF type:complete len:256 (+),score=25.39 TRINITY_DN2400_c0_g1_i2:202-969(+)
MHRTLPRYALRRLLLLGPTGAGKSALGNLLLSRKAFQETPGFASPQLTENAVARETRERFMRPGLTEDDWEICDSIGIGDTGVPQRSVTKALLRELYSEDRDEPIDAAFIVLRADQRMTAAVAKQAQTAAGVIAAPGSSRCLWVVLTHSPEQLRAPGELQKWLREQAEVLPQESLAKLLELVPPERWIAIENPSRDPPSGSEPYDEWRRKELDLLKRRREAALDSVLGALVRQVESGYCLSVNTLRRHIRSLANR